MWRGTCSHDPSASTRGTERHSGVEGDVVPRGCCNAGAVSRLEVLHGVRHEGLLAGIPIVEAQGLYEVGIDEQIDVLVGREVHRHHADPAPKTIVGLLVGTLRMPEVEPDLQGVVDRLRVMAWRVDPGDAPDGREVEVLGVAVR